MFSIESLSSWLSAAAQVVGVAATVAALTPSPKTTGLLKQAHDVLQVLAMNVGHARNATDVGPLAPPAQAAPPRA